jgi:ubiquinone/menaquinone biosynthesis C-methylase UbiE
MTESINIGKQLMEKLFDNAAGSYNRVGPNIFTIFGERLVNNMSLEPGMQVLDVATGTGAVLLPAAKRVGNKGHVTGIDLSNGMLLQTEQNAKAESLTNVTFRKMDAEHLDFPDRSFDAATCAFAVFLFPDMKAALKEIHRVCKPGGYFGLTVFSRTPELFAPALGLFIQLCALKKVKTWQPTHDVAYTPQEMTALLEECGFRSVKTKVEANDIVYAKAEDWWEFLLMGGVRSTIMGMEEKFRASFKEEYCARLRTLFSQDGLHVSIPVLYTISPR